MRYSNLFIPTRREDPADAEVISHKLLVRAGCMRMLARGIYSFLPLGWRVLHKIETIIREEMDRAGAQEVLLPGVQPGDLWEESGRWRLYGPELLRFKDRKNQDFCLGPTHEEVITDLVRGEVRSYKQLPLNLYQIQTKFRDEIRPRAGLMRGREFIMKDAYSFDATKEDALRSYEVMRQAYERTFRRMGLEFRAVEADTGAIGGSASHEFQVLAQSGEDRIVACGSCGYAANVEKAEVVAHGAPPEATGEVGATEEVKTPGKRTIDEVTAFLGVEASALVKTVLFLADDAPVAVLVRGDHDVNEIKVKALLDADVLVLAGEKTVEEVTKAPVGFAGPVGLEGCRIIADQALVRGAGYVVGGNAKDLHVKNAVIGRDFEVEQFADVRMIQEGDPCPRCSDTLSFYRGIEVGHIFYLGTKYSDAMNAVYLDEGGVSKSIEMGCYGMGVTRLMAAAVEQNHDENGICWPMPLAPVEVIILTLGRASEELSAAAQELHDGLVAEGVEVLLDDRNERPAVKFKDADLIGIPLRLTLGNRGLKSGKVEVKWRTGDAMSEVALDEAPAEVAKMVREARDTSAKSDG